MFLVAVGLWATAAGLTHVGSVGTGWAIAVVAYGAVGLLLPGLLIGAMSVPRWGRAMLVLDERGVLDNTPVLGPPLFLGWNQVVRVVVMRRTIPFKATRTAMFVGARDWEAVVAARPRLWRMRIGAASRLVGFPVVMTIEDGLDAPIEEVAELIARGAGVGVEKVG